MLSILQSVRYGKRYLEIIRVFTRHGFGFILAQIELERGSVRKVLHLPTQKESCSNSERLAQHFRLALEELGPTFIKFGQILSTRPDLFPPTYLAELSKLQDNVPAAPWEQIRQVFIGELGCEPEQIFANIEAQPIAAASLSQVYKARLHDGRNVVVKIQRPDITQRIYTDLEILSLLAMRAQKTSFGKLYDFVSIAEDFAYTLKNELDYQREGRNADTFRENFSGESQLYIPHIYWEYSSQRVLVLEYICGIKIDDIQEIDAAGYDRHKIAGNCARIIVKEILLDGFFHADPHAGNYCVLPGEIVGAMDFGLVGYLNNQDRLDLIRLYLTAVALDADGIVDQLMRMGAAGQNMDRKGIVRDIERLLNKYYAMPLKMLRAKDIINEFTGIVFQYHLQLPGNLWLFAKTIVMMEGIGVQLDPDFDIFEFTQPFIRKLERHLILPNTSWKRAAILGGANWTELVHRIPRAGNRLLRHIEEDDFQIGIKNSEIIIEKVDQFVSRLSLSILVGALIVGLSILLPVTSSSTSVQWIIIAGLIMGVGMGIWLIISLIRSR